MFSVRALRPSISVKKHGPDESRFRKSDFSDTRVMWQMYLAEWAFQAVAEAGVGGCETELMLTLLHVTYHKHMFSSIPGSCLQTKKRAHMPCFLKAAAISGDLRGQRCQMATAGSAAREALAC